jgi:uncharacterized protein YcnI
MTQTAVEWLKDLYENQDAYDEFILDEQWEKALEMEKQQIIKAYQQGVTDEHRDTITFTTEGEDYYKSTYKI